MRGPYKESEGGAESVRNYDNQSELMASRIFLASFVAVGFAIFVTYVDIAQQVKI